MRVYIGGWNVAGLSRLVDVHHEKLSRSRTYVNSVKAVRLDDHSMRNATIRLEGDRYVVRYHRTDILSFVGSVVRLHIDGWNTTSTYDRVYVATGIGLRSGGSKNESVHNIRVRSAYGGMSFPYFEGIEIDVNTGEVLNPEKMPVDIRRRTMKMTKEGAMKFRKLWAPVNARLVREIKLGNTLENLQNRATILAYGYDLEGVVAEDTPHSYVEAALRRFCRNYRLGRAGSEPTDELLAGVKKLRVFVQAAWATTNGYMEDIGGSVLTGPKYYGGRKMGDRELRWESMGKTWVLVLYPRVSAPNKIVLRDGTAQFWTRFSDGHHWSNRVSCPYTDIEEAKVWAKREYLLNYAGD